ncbi:NADP-dependent oxidoreductase [Mucilaginibacter terrae]|uniref:NADPH:quinone reductase-like Zn-dependent oxidoreductase n=1 Tax=Mucilaginibacter terrae TaxID=1955052 RepID=A0ABU3GRF5_9SPHI|nr:NADP-dependent oxidoreductase [Mucilaginibacter terrae]MDT3402359.1 NADPH:quinone reductase-like Zn-dependent oxidoreductase [Mucilaginibacter terrae]
MRAIVLKEIGGPENLVLADVPVPQIKDNEVLVQVKAISINPVDAFVRRTKEALNWVYSYKGTEEHIILGWDVAGIVTEAGRAVTKFKKGDEVFGNFKFVGQANAYAEYVAAPETEMVMKPANVSFKEAAGATMSALTAWVSIVNVGEIKKGDKVIIHGASGGVGHFAVQFAKHFGAYVIGVASGQNREFVLSLGADEFIDYQTQRFEDLVKDADLVHDTVWSDDDKHLERSLRSLKPGGTLLSLVIYPDPVFVEQARAEKEVAVLRVNVSPNPTYEQDLESIGRLLSSGEVRTHISHTFPLEDMPKAHAIIQTKNAVGKIIVTP